MIYQDPTFKEISQETYNGFLPDDPCNYDENVPLWVSVHCIGALQCISFYQLTTILLCKVVRSALSTAS